MEIKDLIHDARRRMDSAVEDARKKLAAVRTGRASVSLLDNVRVEYYGTEMPLNQVATIHAPEPTLITLQPFGFLPFGLQLFSESQQFVCCRELAPRDPQIILKGLNAILMLAACSCDSHFDALINPHFLARPIDFPFHFLIENLQFHLG